MNNLSLLTYAYITQDTSELFFEDVRLPSSALLGEANKGFYYLMQELPQERLLISSMGQAACEWMFEETRSYVCQRKAFGRTLSKLQVCTGFCVFVFWVGMKSGVGGACQYMLVCVFV